MRLSLSVLLVLWFRVCTIFFIGSSKERVFSLLFIFQKVDWSTLSVCLFAFFLTCLVVDLSACRHVIASFQFFVLF